LKLNHPVLALRQKTRIVRCIASLQNPVVNVKSQFVSINHNTGVKVFLEEVVS